MSTLPENEQDTWKMKAASDTTSEPTETAVHGKAKHHLKLIAILVVGLLVVSAAAYFFFRMPKAGDATGANKKDRVVPVTVAQARTQELPIEIRSIGNVMPYSVVNIVPQVSGQLTKVTFTQGDFVRKGDLLYQIDPRPYQAALDQALGNVAKDVAGVQAAKANLEKDKAQVGMLQANIEKDKASQKYAQSEMTRYGTLVQQGAVSHEQSDQMSTNAATAGAVIDADKKAVENAKEVLNADKAAIATAQGTLAADQAVASNARLQLEWTQIESPIDGRTGSLNVYQGNIVQANQTTALVTIDQVQPIYIQFTLPEQNLDLIRRAIANNTLKVEALIEGQTKDSVQGTVSFMQNTVDTTSGTVVMRATFANTEKRLYPGQFVDVEVIIPTHGITVVVPATALQTSQQGNSIYVVQPDNTVKFVKVDLKRTFGDLAAVDKGLNPGDTVVTDGQLQLTPGAKVSIQHNIPHEAADSNAGAPPSEKYSSNANGSSSSSNNASDLPPGQNPPGPAHHHGKDGSPLGWGPSDSTPNGNGNQSGGGTNASTNQQNSGAAPGQNAGSQPNGDGQHHHHRRQGPDSSAPSASGAPPSTTGDGSAPR